jgi:hypothetical protein
MQAFISSTDIRGSDGLFTLSTSVGYMVSTHLKKLHRVIDSPIWLGVVPPIFPPEVPYVVSIFSMPIFQSNFGVVMESFVIFLVKGTRNNI